MKTDPVSDLDTQTADRLKSFATALDALRAEIKQEIGAEDVEHLLRLDRISHLLEGVGRVLIHVSIEPISFFSGVGALWLHKQLQMTEIGHPALHGCYDGLEGAERFAAKVFRWDSPIDEASWRHGHNVLHHMYTNVKDKDIDIHFGPVRLTAQTPHRPIHYLQLPYLLLISAVFATTMNMHFTGVFDIAREEPELLPDRSMASLKGALRSSFRKYVPYFAKNYVFYPALAGPFFWKVLLGNWMAETGRDLFSAACIICGHVGEDLDSYDGTTRPQGRGGWYARQVRSSRNFRAGRLSVLCGGLDYQIEHHLFPELPPERLRQIAPAVQRICEEHGIPYHTAPWPEVLRSALGRVWELSFPLPEERAAAAAAAAATATPT